MYLRLYVEATLKYPNSEYHTLLVMPDEGKESKVVNSILKKENVDDQNQGWYGTKEDIKDSEDFFPFVLIKLSVPLSFTDH
jgi:V-type H+-transporting ATPase subunit C